MIDFEFYETPQSHVRCLFDELRTRSIDLGTTFFEPCVGSAAILRGAEGFYSKGRCDWFTNDLDQRWPANFHDDATRSSLWQRMPSDLDTTISNTHFTGAIDILDHALRHSQRAVVLYLRASIHEVLKQGPRRTFLREHPPTGIVWLPRFSYQRSRTKGTWTTDSVCTGWCVWMKVDTPKFIGYADESVLRAQEAETPIYRARMDELNGLAGSEAERQLQWVARWKAAA